EMPGGKDDFKIECVFNDPDMAENIAAESEYMVVGKVQPFKSGKTITLKNATFLAQSGGKAAAVRPPADGRFVAANRPGLRWVQGANVSPITPQMFTNPTDPNGRPLSLETLCPSWGVASSPDLRRSSCVTSVGRSEPVLPWWSYS